MPNNESIFWKTAILDIKLWNVNFLEHPVHCLLNNAIVNYL